MGGPISTRHVGVDMGATLAKIAIEESDPQSGADAVTRFELLPAGDPDRVAQLVVGLAPRSVGLTGCGARDLARRLPSEPAQVNEFAAWGAGASRLLRRDAEAPGRYLLVSLGTGTSVLLVDGMSFNRVGGTALGGGTVTGLCSLLVGSSDWAEICKLAEQGRRENVDLLVRDIYRAGEIPLMGALTASCFGKLARSERGSGGVDGDRAEAGAGMETPRHATPTREDLAAAVMGLVGSNVALICAGLAAATQVSRLVFGGSTLRDNPSLANLIVGTAGQLGREALLLPDGEFAGALGGLELARAR